MGEFIRSRRGWLLSLLLGAAVLLTACQPDQGPTPLLDGGCAPDASPYLDGNDRVVDGRITYCLGGDSWTGAITSGRFPAGTNSLNVLVAGYPDGGAVRLVATTADGADHAVLSLERAGDTWQPALVPIPADFQDREFRIQLEDTSADPFGWAGIGYPADIPLSAHSDSMAAAAAGLAFAHLWLVFAGLCLPFAWPAMARASAATVVLGVAGFAVFLAYVAAPAAGPMLAFACLLAPAPALVALRKRADTGRHLAALHHCVAPATLLAAVVIWIGLYPFNWNGVDWQIPANRWRNMPMDNWLPFHLAEMTAQGRIIHPMIGDWLSSDRPPLQSGLYLLFRDILPGQPGLAYQAISTWAQTLMLVPLGLLLTGVKRPLDRALFLLVIGLSALVVLNSLFVWPKLLAAGYCAIYHVMLFRDRAVPSPARDAAAGLAAGLALLSHGGAFFALAGSSITFLAMRRSGSLKPLLLAAAAAFTAYLPWMLYQRLLDPPGDRLLKWHFAGQIVPTDAALGDVLADAYAGISPTDWLAGRVANIETLTDGTLRFFTDLANLVADPGNRAIVQSMTDNSFFHLAYSLWLFSPLLILPLLLFNSMRRAPSEFPPPKGLLGATIAGLAVWILLMFVPGTTVLHQGGYFVFIAVQLLVMALVLNSSAGLFRVLAAGNVGVFLALYAFDRPMAVVPAPAAYAAGVALLSALFFTATLVASRHAGPQFPIEGQP